MIFDAENTFYWEKEVKGTTTGTSDVIKTGLGDAGCPLTLYAAAGGTTSTITLTLETSDTETFDTAVTLGTYTLPQTGTVKAKIPYGDKGYLRLKYTSTASLTAGTLDAALVMDADIA